MELTISIDVNRLCPEIAVYEKMGFTITSHDVMDNWKKVTLPVGWRLEKVFHGFGHDLYQLINEKNECKGEYLVTDDFGGTKLELKLQCRL